MGPPDARPLVVLLHGKTANAVQLAPLADAIRGACAAQVVVPDAPIELAGFAGGRSWWPVSVGAMLRQRGRGEHQDLTGARPDGMDDARRGLERLIDAHAAPDAPVIVAGFSQGAMLAVDLALKATRRPTAIALMAGTIVDERDWLAAMPRAAGLPVLMLHGRGDEVLRIETAARLRDQLRAAGAVVTWHEDDAPHAVTPAMIAAVTAFVVSESAR